MNTNNRSLKSNALKDVARLSASAAYLTHIYEDRHSDPFFSHLMPVILSTVHLLQGIIISLNNFIYKSMKMDYSCIDSSIKYIILKSNNINEVVDDLLSVCHKYFFSQVAIATEKIILQLLPADWWKTNKESTIKELNTHQENTPLKYRIPKDVLKKIRKSLDAQKERRPTFFNICEYLKNHFLSKDIEWSEFLDAARILRNSSSHGSLLKLLPEERNAFEKAWPNDSAYLIVDETNIKLDTKFYGIFLNRMILFLELLRKRRKENDVLKCIPLEA